MQDHRMMLNATEATVKELLNWIFSRQIVYVL